jgi:hypothetical protein
MNCASDCNKVANKKVTQHAARSFVARNFKDLDNNVAQMSRSMHNINDDLSI